MSRARKFSDDELAALHGQGQSDHEIAAALGASHSTVQVRRRGLGLPTHYDPSADRPARRIATPKPASHIVITGKSEFRNARPDADDPAITARRLRKWRIGLIKGAAQRAQARKETVHEQQ